MDGRFYADELAEKREGELRLYDVVHPAAQAFREKVRARHGLNPPEARELVARIIKRDAAVADAKVDGPHILVELHDGTNVTLLHTNL